MTDRTLPDQREVPGASARAHSPDGPALDASQVAAIRVQLERLTASAFFKASKRCQLLLRRVVDHSIQAVDGASPGDPEPLKERVLGVEVFGREPHYDTAADPIVRVTAGEIRRRLGQYYADPAHQHELRVDLPAGHYAALYTWPSTTTTSDTHGASQTSPAPPGSSPAGNGHHAVHGAPVSDAIDRDADGTEVGAWPSTPAHAPRPRRAASIVGLAGAVLAAAIVLLGIITSSREPTAAARFWDPLLRAEQPVLVCTGAIDISHISGRLWEAAHAPDQPEEPRQTPTPPAGENKQGAAFVTVTDAMALARMVALFHERAKPYRIRTDRATSFADLRASPTVLVGLFNNTWTLRLTSDFRFMPSQDDGGGAFLIRDRATPTRTWRPDKPWPDLTLNRDYAFVSRVFDPATGNIVVMAAGITPYGTVAAAELLTSAPHLEEALRRLPENWHTKNLQIVLETQILDGAAGPPRVVDTHVW